MPKFRKKPVIIKAEQFIENQPIPKGVCFGWLCGDRHAPPHVHTIHGNQRVNIEFGDWIIPEPDEEHYCPVKPDIFAATYESAEPEDPIAALADEAYARANARYGK